MASVDLDAMTGAAVAHAARTTGLEATSLRVVSAERVLWRDGSIGCPVPGRHYPQSLVPGYRIRIQAADAVLDYHASEHGKPVLCPLGRAIEPLPDARS